MWYRVFGLNDAVIPVAALQEALRAAGWDVPFHVRGDDCGWTSIDMDLGPGGPPVHVERYLTEADEIRDDLHAWAAWLETQEQQRHNEHLMQHVIGTKQLFTLRRPLDHADEDALATVCELIVRTIAERTEGVYQIDTHGFFAANGRLILPENTNSA